MFLIQFDATFYVLWTKDVQNCELISSIKLTIGYSLQCAFFSRELFAIKLKPKVFFVSLFGRISYGALNKLKIIFVIICIENYNYLLLNAE